MTETTVRKDYDQTNPDAKAGMWSLLMEKFHDDPMMKFFDQRVLDKLCNVIVDEVHGEDLNFSQAAYQVEWSIIPNKTPLGAFGKPVAGRIAYLVQRAWYPSCFKESSWNV